MDGTLLAAWASHASLERIDGKENPPPPSSGPGEDIEKNFWLDLDEVFSNGVGIQRRAPVQAARQRKCQ